MRTVTFGSTGRQVSSIGLGGGQYVYNSDAERETIVDVIRYAHQLGINYFDTAPWYQSESTFGEALEKIDRSSYFMATKVGRYPNKDLLKVNDLTAQTTEDSVMNSLRELRTDYIDLVQIHDFDYAENCMSMIQSETLPVLDKLRQRGIVKYIGLACYDLPKMKKLVEESPIKIDSVLSHSRLTLVDQGFKDYIGFFKQKEVATINAATLSLGLLSSNPIPSWMNIHPDLKAASQKAVTTCQLSKYIIERLANGYSYTQCENAGVDVLLTGAATRKVLDLNLKAYIEGLTKAEKTMCQELVDIFAALPQEVRDINRKSNEVHLKDIAAARAAAQQSS